MSREKKRGKRVKRKIRKLYISTVAVIMATVTLVFCFNHFYNRTNIFNIVGFEFEGNQVYSFEYLVSKTGIKLGEKLFDINREKVKENLKKEVYIKDCKVAYYIPNKVSIKIIEREEKYLITYGDEIIVTDENAYVLDGNLQNNALFPIESFVPVVYNIGDEIKFDGLYSFSKINELLEYSNSLSDIDRIEKIYIHEDNVISVDTKYGMRVKFGLDEDYLYSYNFSLNIIKERLQEGQEVEGCTLDYTKGDHPVFSEKIK